jgi:hypothetical protein
VSLVSLAHISPATTPAHLEEAEAAFRNEQAIPAPNGVVVEKQSDGDPLAVPPVVEKHESVGATRNSMRRRAVPRQGDQVRRQIASGNHVPKTNPYPKFWQSLSSPSQ